MVINSRSLSYMSASDLEEPLTPSHLMVGRKLMDAPEGLDPDPDDFNTSPDALTRRAKYLNFTIYKFWERWRREYLVELREAHKQCKRNRSSSGPRVAVGDVVIIHDDNLPRGMWNLCRVKELLVGNDGEVRGAVLRVAGQGRRARCLRRPEQKLYPLEMSTQDKETETSPEPTGNPPAEPDDLTQEAEHPSSGISLQLDGVPPPSTGRPRRAAALEARARVLALILDEDENIS